MKKRITEQQLLELSDEALARLTNWRSDRGDLQVCALWNRRGIVAPQCTIGDMLEFLDERGITPTLLPGPVSQWCDMLWSIVKSQLECTESACDHRKISHDHT